MATNVYDPTAIKSRSQLLRSSPLTKWIIRLAIIFTVALAFGAAFAIDPDEATGYVDPISIPIPSKAEAERNEANAAVVIGKVVGQMMSAISSIADGGALSKTGIVLIVVFAAVKIVWSVPINLFGGKGANQVFAEIAVAVLFVAVGGFAISAGFAESLAKTVGQLGTIVSKAIAGKSFTGMEKLDGHGDVVQFLGAFMSNVMNVFAVMPDWGDYKFSESPQFVINVLLWALSFIILMACTAIAVGTLIVAHAVVAFGCCFAPVFIACGTWKPTSGLFNAWMRYLIAGAFTKVCVTIMAMIVSLAIANLADLKGKLSGGEVVSMGTYAAILLIAIFSAYLMTKASNIAGDMIGATTLGGDGIMAPAMGAARTTGRAASDTANAAKGAAKGAKNAAVSLGQGAKLGYTNDAGSIGETKGGLGNSVARVVGYGAGAAARRASGGGSGGEGGGGAGLKPGQSAGSTGALPGSGSQSGNATAGLAAAGLPAGQSPSQGHGAGSGPADSGSATSQTHQGSGAQAQGGGQSAGSHPAFSQIPASAVGSGSTSVSPGPGSHPAFSKIPTGGGGAASSSPSLGPGSHPAFSQVPPVEGRAGWTSSAPTPMPSAAPGQAPTSGPSPSGQRASPPPAPSMAAAQSQNGAARAQQSAAPAPPPQSALAAAFLGKKK